MPMTDLDRTQIASVLDKLCDDMEEAEKERAGISDAKKKVC
jgi:hypothetical protein